MKRVACWLGVALVAGVMCGHAQSVVDIQLLAINDFHGNLEPPRGSSGLINGVPAGGAEYLATHLAEARKQNPHTLIVGGGDMMGASPLLSALFSDKPTIEALNAMGLSITAVGNHELDPGIAKLKERLHDAKYQYLAANMHPAGKMGETIFPASTVRTVGGVKIGFIGETLEDAPTVVAAKSVAGLSFEDEAAAANRAAAELEKQGVHTIVLLVHDGGQQHGAYDAHTQLDPDGCEGMSGRITSVAEKLSPSIAIVISAHTHLFYNCRISGHVVTSASSYGRMFTRIRLSIDPRTDRIVNLSAHNEVVTRDVPKDPAQTAIIARYLPEEKKVADRPEGAITANISKTENETGESAMGDLIADAQLAATSAKENGGAQVAFMNPGGIRGDLAIPAGSTVPYTIRYADLAAAQPFGNQLTVHTYTGAQLRALLEQQFQPNGKKQIMLVAGMHYTYRQNAEPGHHIVEMTIAGKTVQPGDSIRVEASDFMVAGAEGLTVFREGKDPFTGPVDLEALTDYFRKHSPVAPGPLNRIERID